MENSEHIFFDQDFFKDLISALIGTLSALLIFYLTLRHDKKKDQKLEKQQNLRRLNYLSNLVTSVKNQTITFKNNLDKNIENFNDDKLHFHQMVKNPNSSLHRLDEIINDENYFLAYFQEYGETNVKKYNNMSLQIDYFIAQEKQVYEMNEAAQKFDYNRKAAFVSNINNLMNRASFLPKQPGLLEEGYIRELNNIFEYYNNNLKDLSDLQFQYSHMIRPIIERVLIHNLDKPEIRELIAEFKNASILFNEIKLQNDKHKEDLEMISGNYQESIDSFIKDGEELIKTTANNG